MFETVCVHVRKCVHVVPMIKKKRLEQSLITSGCSYNIEKGKLETSFFFF